MRKFAIGLPVEAAMRAHSNALWQPDADVGATVNEFCDAIELLL